MNQIFILLTLIRWVRKQRSSEAMSHRWRAVWRVDDTACIRFNRPENRTQTSRTDNYDWTITDLTDLAFVVASIVFTIFNHALTTLP